MKEKRKEGMVKPHRSKWIVSFRALELAAVVPYPPWVAHTAVQNIGVPDRDVLDPWPDEDSSVPSLGCFRH